MFDCQKEMINQIQYGISKNNGILNMDMYCKQTGILGSIGINTNNPKYLLGDLIQTICLDCQYQSACHSL